MDQLRLELVNIEVSFGDQTILDIPRLTVYQFDRIGIVGKNGAGKSTLLKLLAGSLAPDKGQVNRFIDFRYFDQTAEPLGSDCNYELISRLSVPNLEIHQLSGGEQTRMKLAQLFSMYHEGLLIDEPTTHLDLSGTSFLIEELKYYYGALVLVSHDREVLNQLVTKIWELEDGRITEYDGNYSDYVQQKEMARKQEHERYEKYVKDKSRLLNAAEKKMQTAEKVAEANHQMSKKAVKTPANRMFMTKSKESSKKAMQRAAKAIEKRANQLEAVEAPVKEAVLHFHQAQALELHNKFPIMAESVTICAGEKLLLNDVSFQIPLGKTVAITGDNGTGKTTLLKYIVQKGPGIVLSPKVVFGVYEQHSFRFECSQSVISFMRMLSDYQESKIRAVLHAMNFTGNDLSKDVSDLSGGEAIRLVLCQLFLGRFNVLVLDEPTSFLDLDCLRALETFIHAYQGTVLLVSHDRLFVENTAEHVYEISEQQLKLKSVD